MIGQMPVLEQLTRSNPVWKVPGLATPPPLLQLQNMALEVLKEYQDAKSVDEKRRCLIQALLEAQQADHGNVSMSDVLAISMGAM